MEVGNRCWEKFNPSTFRQRRINQPFNLPPKADKSTLQPLYKLLFILILTLIAANAFAQVRASARLDSSYLLIGDQAELKLIVDSALNVKDLQTDLSVFDTLPGLEVVRHSDWNPVGINRGSGSSIFEQRITITSFEEGTHPIPDIPIKYAYNRQPYTVVAPGRAVLEVATIAVTDTTQLTPIKPIITEPLKFQDLLVYLIPVVILGLIIAAVIFYLRWKKQKNAPPPPPPPLKPHEVALQKLNELEEEKLWQQGYIKQFQTELTFIIREYLEHQFYIPALENTTDEITANLKGTSVSDYWKDKLRIIFQNADLVKFAKAEPPTEIHEQGLDEAKRFVEATKPVEIKEPETQAQS